MNDLEALAKLITNEVPTYVRVAAKLAMMGVTADDMTCRGCPEVCKITLDGKTQIVDIDPKIFWDMREIVRDLEDRNGNTTTLFYHNDKEVTMKLKDIPPV